MKSVDDLNGLKLIVAGRMQSQTVSALEGAPISIPLTDMYQAIQRKLVIGVVTGWGSVQSFKLDQVAPYHVDVSIGASVSMVFMAKAKFQSLPEKAQKLLLDTAGEQLSRQFGIAVDNDAAAVRGRILAQSGQSVITLPPATLEKWRAKAEPVVAAWAQSRNGGQAVLEKFRALYAEAEAGR
jgi:TRAP-type C4-dicarboxylate transport system substrate-binding protein